MPGCGTGGVVVDVGVFTNLKGSAMTRREMIVETSGVRRPTAPEASATLARALAAGMVWRASALGPGPAESQGTALAGAQLQLEGADARPAPGRYAGFQLGRLIVAAAEASPLPAGGSTMIWQTCCSSGANQNSTVSARGPFTGKVKRLHSVPLMSSTPSKTAAGASARVMLAALLKEPSGTGSEAHTGLPAPVGCTCTASSPGSIASETLALPGSVPRADSRTSPLLRATATEPEV
mmetsp:Transcript_28331/g.90104  ORF Transcript_28331/g.90104 Transcript_28331/m.90104 type:complete len:237 (+) Transcript_28331:847-1557(+)